MSVVVSADTHCPDCFQPPRPAPVCRHCGFDWRTYQDTASHLPPFTALAEGRYLVGRVLGRPGGFGVVYAGWHSGLQSQVAIKEFFPGGLGVAGRARDGQGVTARTDHADLFGRWKERFLREARLLARFRGTPHIVTVYDVFQANGTAYLVMERLYGQSLSDYLGGLRQGPRGELVTDSRLAPAQAEVLLEGLLAALERLHAAQVYHRDVTPNNVFLVEGDPARVKLLDFGLASSGEDPRRGLTSVGVGTPGFAAPEQSSREGKIGPATDLYALGATLYTALAGVAPPNAELRKSGVPLVPLRSRVPGLAAPLAELIDTCLALEVERRPQSVADVRLVYSTPSQAQVEESGYGTLLPEGLGEPVSAGPVAEVGEPMPPEPVSGPRGRKPFGTRLLKAVLGMLLVALIGYAGLRFIQDRPVVEEKPRVARVEQPPEMKKPLPEQPAKPPEPFAKPEKLFRDSLKDGSPGPEMVAIPPGRFQMGDPRGGGPARPVVIGKPFALSRYEVTVDDYLRCVQAAVCHAPQWAQSDAGDYYKKLGDALTDRRHPIVGVSWYDAMAYAWWLSQQTGKAYRLPTEAEWEYAARSGTQSAYGWGDSIGRNQANCDGCGSPWDKRRPAPVGSFAANAFGFYDMAGNVAEWTCSPWAEGYQGQEQVCADPADPVRRVIRGGAWDNEPGQLRATVRYGAYPPDYQSNNLGFRLARDL